MRAAKFVVALVGAAASGILEVVTPDSGVAHWAGFVVALCTAVAVYLVPNRPDTPTSPGGRAGLR